jgi:hypothetical protein
MENTSLPKRTCPSSARQLLYAVRILVREAAQSPSESDKA